MSKKQLLSEVRRFMKLANVNTGAASNFIKKLDENDIWSPIQEEEEEDEFAEMPPMGDPSDMEVEDDMVDDMEVEDDMVDDMGVEDEMDLGAPSELGAEEAISNAVEAISALGDLLGVSMEVEGAPGVPDELELADDELGDELAGDELGDELAGDELGDELADDDEEETLGEIINSALKEEEKGSAPKAYNEQAIVNEVLKRVSRRIKALTRTPKKKRR